MPPHLHLRATCEVRGTLPSQPQNTMQSASTAFGKEVFRETYRVCLKEVE
jgi:hypothetical protein